MVYVFALCYCEMLFGNVCVHLHFVVQVLIYTYWWLIWRNGPPMVINLMGAVLPARWPFALNVAVLSAAVRFYHHAMSVSAFLVRVRIFYGPLPYQRGLLTC